LMPKSFLTDWSVKIVMGKLGVTRWEMGDD
jgi:hypothetical protein